MTMRHSHYAAPPEETPVEERRRRAQQDARILQALMAINEAETTRQLRLIEDGARMDKYHRFAEKWSLRRANHLETVHSVGDLDRCLWMIKTHFRTCLRSAQFLTLLSARLLRATKAIQAFVRRVLAISYERKAFILERWKETEDAARRRIRMDIDARTDQSHNHPGSQRALEELWDCYMACWIGPQEMTRTVTLAIAERKRSYLARYRAWKADVKLRATAAATDRDTVTSLRARIRRACNAYGAFRCAHASVSIAELAAHAALLQRMRVYDRCMRAGIDAASSSGGGGEGMLRRQASVVGPRRPPKNVGEASLLVSPVSFYHALLMYDASHAYLCRFLRLLMKGEPARAPAGAAPPVRLQAEHAVVIFERWASNDDALAASAKLGGAGGNATPDGKRRPPPDHAERGPNGQPVSCYSPIALRRFNAEAGTPEAQQSPATGRRVRSLSPSTPRVGAPSPTAVAASPIAVVAAAQLPAARARQRAQVRRQRRASHASASSSSSGSDAATTTTPRRLSAAQRPPAETPRPMSPAALVVQASAAASPQSAVATAARPPSAPTGSAAATYARWAQWTPRQAGGGSQHARRQSSANVQRGRSPTTPSSVAAALLARLRPLPEAAVPAASRIAISHGWAAQCLAQRKRHRQQGDPPAAVAAAAPTRGPATTPAALVAAMLPAPVQRALADAEQSAASARHWKPHRPATAQGRLQRTVPVPAATALPWDDLLHTRPLRADAVYRWGTAQ